MKKTNEKEISYAKYGYLFIAPFFIAFLIFQFIPLVQTIYYSFFEYYRSGLSVIGPNPVGLENYSTLFASDFGKYAGNTIIMWLLGFVPQIIVSLILAAWFTDVRLKIRGKQFFKVVIYMPNLIMASAFAMLFFALFSDNGPVNSTLISMGVLSHPFRFLSSVGGSRGLVGLMNFLMWFGNTTGYSGQNDNDTYHVSEQSLVQQELWYGRCCLSNSVYHRCNTVPGSILHAQC